MKRKLWFLALLAALAVLTGCSLGKERPPVEDAPAAEAPAAEAPASQPDSDRESQPEETPPDREAEEPAPALQEAPAPAAEAEQAACTLSITCAVLLDRLDQLEEGVRELVPADGVLLPPTAVELEEGDSVFDLLQRACREAGIHMEYTDTPGYGSACIEGIGNLYEFDGGPLSGWMYRVNGTFPNKGCSGVAAAPGDRVEWVYTCDLGRDVGGEDSGQLGA